MEPRHSTSGAERGSDRWNQMEMTRGVCHCALLALFLTYLASLKSHQHRWSRPPPGILNKKGIVDLLSHRSLERLRVQKLPFYTLD